MKRVSLASLVLTALLGASSVYAEDKLPSPPPPAPTPPPPAVVPTPGNPYNLPPLNGPGLNLPNLPGSPTLIPSGPPLGGPPGGGIIIRFPF